MNLLPIEHEYTKNINFSEFTDKFAEVKTQNKIYNVIVHYVLTFSSKIKLI